MIMYALYRVGYFFAMIMPVKVSYGLAYIIAHGCYFFCSMARRSVISNLKIVTGNGRSEKELKQMARRVFINFAKYLADFFRFSKFDKEYIKKMVVLEGLDNIDEGLSRGKGVIALSAHLGNWELGGIVLARLRSPLSAVALSHSNKRIDDLFTRQRGLTGLKSIPIGMALRGCFEALKNNGLLALLGDRDFSRNGIYTPFFGHPAFIPKGPAVFSYRIGSAIVPTFMVREKDDTFRFIFDKPIYPDMRLDEETCIKAMMEKYSGIIEFYVKRYPDQWYMFREVWGGNGK